MTIGHNDRCADCGKLLPSDDFSSVRCPDGCSPLSQILRLRATLAIINQENITDAAALRWFIDTHGVDPNDPPTDADLGQLSETQEWMETRS